MCGPKELSAYVVCGPMGLTADVVFLVSNGGFLILAKWIKFSYCSSAAVKVVPGVAGLMLLAVSHADLKVCFAQFSLGLPTLFAAGYNGFPFAK